MTTETPKHNSNGEKLTFLIKLLLLFFLLYVRLLDPGWKESLHVPQHVVNAILFYIITHLLVSFTRITLVRLYARRRRSEQDRGNFLLGINQIANILGVMFLFFSVLMLLNIDIRELFTSLSIIAAAIAVLSKDYISNMINGMIIMFSDQYSLNDYLKIGSHRGRLINISLINIQIKNDNDDIVSIPNTTFFNSDVVNYTRKNIHEGNIEFEVKYPHMKGLAGLQQAIAEDLGELQEHLVEGSIEIKPIEVRQDSTLVNFQYLFNDHQRDRSLEIEIRKRVLTSVVRYVSSPNK